MKVYKYIILLNITIHNIWYAINQLAIKLIKIDL